MTEDFTSKFHFWKVFVTMTLSTLFFFGMGYLFMFEVQSKPGDSKTWLFIFGLACFIFGVYLLYVYIKQLPVIRIDYGGVSLKSFLGKQKFSWDDIERIKYTGKDSFQFFLGYQMESITIQLKDKRIIKLFYEHYANSYLIQQYIKSYHDHQRPPVLLTEEKVSVDELSGESFAVYKGMPWLSFRGISLWVLILFMFILVLKDGAAGKAIIPASLICVLWYGINSYFCFYIQLSDRYLVIRNYFLPFIMKRYRLSDIREIAVEAHHKWPNCLRVISHSFRYEIYPCGPVWDKEWKLLMKQLQDKGIQVRNEALI